MYLQLFRQSAETRQRMLEGTYEGFRIECSYGVRKAQPLRS